MLLSSLPNDVLVSIVEGNRALAAHDGNGPIMLLYAADIVGCPLLINEEEAYDLGWRNIVRSSGGVTTSGPATWLDFGAPISAMYGLPYSGLLLSKPPTRSLRNESISSEFNTFAAESFDDFLARLDVLSGTITSPAQLIASQSVGDSVQYVPDFMGRGVLIMGRNIALVPEVNLLICYDRLLCDGLSFDAAAALVDRLENLFIIDVVDVDFARQCWTLVMGT